MLVDYVEVIVILTTPGGYRLKYLIHMRQIVNALLDQNIFFDDCFAKVITKVFFSNQVLYDGVHAFFKIVKCFASALIGTPSHRLIKLLFDRKNIQVILAENQPFEGIFGG